jgi:hypothetical protein
MTDSFETGSEYSFDDDVSLDQDQKNAGSTKQEWLKFGSKGEQKRAAFVYLYTVDANAVQKARKEAIRAGKKLTREEELAVAKGALTKRAQEVGKTLDQLSAIEKLDTSVAHFKALKAHFHESVGYAISRLGKDGPEADAVWKRLGDVKSYFTTLLLIYPTTAEGAVDKEQFASQAKNHKLKLIPWRFSVKTYDEIYGVNEGLRDNNLSLASQDVKITCDNPKYQGVKVVAAGPATWQKNEGIKAAVLTAALNKYDGLNPFRELSTDQIREKLNLGGGSSTAGDDASVDSFNDLLEGV